MKDSHLVRFLYQESLLASSFEWPANEGLISRESINGGKHNEIGALHISLAHTTSTHNICLHKWEGHDCDVHRGVGEGQLLT